MNVPLEVHDVAQRPQGNANEKARKLLLLGRVRRKRLALFVAGMLLALTGGANAADAVPQQFVDEWCADAKTPQLQPSKYESDPKTVIYRRARKCNAHEPEETITIRSDRLLNDAART
jgi:hypothetical protein